MRQNRKNDSSGLLHGKVALITGATRGIGLALATALATEGCHLALSGRDLAALKQISTELSNLGVKVLATPCDVGDPASVKACCAAIKAKFKRVDFLINNAGIGHANLPVRLLPIESWTDVITTNLTGMFLVTQSVLPLMRRGGAVVNNLSIAARTVFPGSSAYNASKHGALGFTNTLREELRSEGIRVIAVLPGATDTGIWKALWPDAPRKKMMSPATVASVIVNALTQPTDSTVEELVIMPASGTL